MVTAQDREWLSARYPGLLLDNGAIAGTVEFTASYDGEKREFLILEECAPGTHGGLPLTGKFRISIRERTDFSFSRLPAVFVQEVEATAVRHFGQSDKTACLCSPLEEDEFLQPEFQFQRFFQKLVIPFLYGQVFYSLHQRWPWSEYEHGSTGLLEAYGRVGDSTKAKDCVEKLARDRNWSKIRSALQQKPYVKGHTPCFCGKEDHLRRCHPDALKGLRQLQLDIESQSIRVP